MKTLCMMVATLLLVGCVTPNSPHAAVDIDAAKTKFKEALASVLIERQWEILSDSDFVLVADRKANAMATFLFTNTSTGEGPRNRIRFNFTETAGRVRATGTPYFVTAAGFSGRQSESEITQDAARVAVQYVLDCAAADTQGTPRPTEPPRQKVNPVTSPKN